MNESIKCQWVNPIAISLLSLLGTMACSDNTDTSPNTTAPAVLNTSPVDGAIGVNLNFPPRATFSESIDGYTVNSSSVLLQEGVNTIAVDVTYSSDGSNAVTLTPNSPLDRNTQYSATLTSAIADLDGNTLISDETWNFTTTWTVQAGSVNTDRAYDLVVDGSGNIYTLIRTEGSIDGNTHGGSSDFALVKYNPAGDLQWSKQFGSTQTDIPRALTLTNDAVYVTGYTNGDIDGAGPLSALGNTDIVVAKYFYDGSLEWMIQDGTTEFDEAYDITTDGTDIFVTGLTSGNYAGPLTNQGAADALVMKLDSSGTLHWVAQTGSSFYDRANGIVISDSNVYITGITFGDFDGAGSGTSAGQRDIFLAKFDSNGTLLWSDQFGTSDDDVARDIAADINNIYITGDTRSGLDGNTHTTGNCISGNITISCRDVFVSNYLPNGTRQWTYQTGSPFDDLGWDVKLDNDLLYIAGIAGGQINNQSFWGRFDMLVMKLSTNGAHQWTRLHGTPSATAGDEAFGIAIHSNNIYVAGASNEDLNGHQSIGGHDAFVVKYNADGLLH